MGQTRGRRRGGRRRPPHLAAVFEPRSVAVVGASEDPAKWGGSVMRNLLDGGYGGALYPVNGRGGAVLGVTAFAALADLPETPELAVVALGGAQAVAVVEECGRLGVTAAVVIAAGFAEAGGRGAALQERLTRTAADGTRGPGRTQLHGRARAPARA